MTTEQKELYMYTKQTLNSELLRISKNSISPIMAVRSVVKMAMKQYSKDYCTNNENPFSTMDFQKVSYKICEEILELD